MKALVEKFPLGYEGYLRERELQVTPNPNPSQPTDTGIIGDDLMPEEDVGSKANREVRGSPRKTPDRQVDAGLAEACVERMAEESEFERIEVTDSGLPVPKAVLV